MDSNKPYSDEHLNAFIDDQLGTSEKAELLDALRHDAELSQRVCKLQKIHNLVQLSYESIEVPEHYQMDKKPVEQSKLKWVVAASVLLVVGTITGWYTNEAVSPKNLYDLAEIKQHSGPAKNDKWQLMLHVSSANTNRLNLVLDEAESLLQEYAAASKNLQLEILTNSEGIALVTNNQRLYNNRLQNLQAKYDNLVVVACGETLKRIQKTQGKPVDLLPRTSVVTSAIKQIVKRQKQGWSYIRI